MFDSAVLDRKKTNPPTVDEPSSKGCDYTLTPVTFPDFKQFAASCRRGLSVIYPLKAAAGTDPYGWRFGTRWPPSYWAFGRMRSLLTLKDALTLRPKRVLEVAAGGSGLAACLAKAGCAVVINDLQEDGTKAAIKEYANGDALQFIPGNLFDLSPQTVGKFDLVIACEVIEHVADPIGLLDHLKQFLEPRGRMLLTTPNGAHFRNRLPTFAEVEDFKELESRQFMPDADGHLFLFTPAELRAASAMAGLEVEQLSCWGTPLLTGHAALRFLAGPPMTRVAYRAEVLAQRLRPAKRERICAAIAAMFRRRD
jgi:2-polyprenyl-3-methyl-5-hydroxy-6-metoxy-1,4-benzoquinol methylase